MKPSTVVKSKTRKTAESVDKLIQSIMIETGNLAETSFPKGTRLFTSHKPTAGVGTSLGPDPDSKYHTLVKIGNSTKSIPTKQLHKTRAEAQKNESID